MELRGAGGAVEPARPLPARRGLQTGDVVAVWAHRGASLVWAVYGALKAGGTFMILDPAYPATRLVDYLRIGRPKAWLAVDGAPPPPEEVESVLLGLSCNVRILCRRSGRPRPRGASRASPRPTRRSPWGRTTRRS